MIFTENKEKTSNIDNIFNIINESEKIDITKLISPKIVPLIEDKKLGGYIIRFDDVKALSDAYGYDDYIESIISIAETNNIDPSYLAVAINESDIILNPDIIYELSNIVTIPQSENSVTYRFCEACIDRYVKTNNEKYLNLLVEFDSHTVIDMVPKNSSDEIDLDLLTKDMEKSSDGNIDDTDDTVGEIYHTVKIAAIHSADWIARKISALRHLYSAWQNRLRQKILTNQADKFQEIVEKVLSAIDWALEKLQHMLEASKENKEKFKIK